MKKFLSLTLALAMLGTALTGCSSKDAASLTSAESTQQTAPVRQEQSQAEKALALINTFATGDTDTARSLLSDGYIQHNLAYAPVPVSRSPLTSSALTRMARSPSIGT